MTTQQVIALYDLIHDSIETGRTFTVLYATGGDKHEIKMRTMRALSLWHTDFGGDIGFDYFSAHDSLRPGAPVFRVDRIIDIVQIVKLPAWAG